MARAIDGELLELEIANIANKLAKSDAQKALMGRVMYCVEHMPTLTPQNEPLTWNELGNMMMGNAATILSTKGIAMDITPPTLCRGNVYLKQSYSQNICVPLTSDEIHMELDIAINVN